MPYNDKARGNRKEARSGYIGWRRIKFAVECDIDTCVFAFIVLRNNGNKVRFLVVVVQVFFGKGGATRGFLFSGIAEWLGGFFFVAAKRNQAVCRFMLFGCVLLTGIHKRKAYGKPEQRQDH